MASGRSSSLPQSRRRSSGDYWRWLNAALTALFVAASSCAFRSAAAAGALPAAGRAAQTGDGAASAEAMRPRGVHLSYGSAPTQMVVIWSTAAPAPGSSCVEYKRVAPKAPLAAAQPTEAAPSEEPAGSTQRRLLEGGAEGAAEETTTPVQSASGVQWTVFAGPKKKREVTMHKVWRCRPAAGTIFPQR